MKVEAFIGVGEGEAAATEEVPLLALGKAEALDCRKCPNGGADVATIRQA